MKTPEGRRFVKIYHGDMPRVISAEEAETIIRTYCDGEGEARVAIHQLETGKGYLFPGFGLGSEVAPIL